MNKLRRIIIVAILIIVGFFVAYGAVNLFGEKSEKISPPTTTEEPQVKKSSSSFIYSFYNDGDNDELSNAKEIVYGSDPKKADTDNDTYLDGIEVKSGYDPIIPGASRIRDRDSQNLTIQYFSWVQEKYKVDDPILQDSSINEYLNLRFPQALELPPVPTEDLIIIYDESAAAIQEYLIEINNIELPQSFSSYPDLYEKMLIGEKVDIDGILKELGKSTQKLYNMRVPAKALDVHKQYLGIMEALKVIFADLENTQKDPVLIKLDIRKGQDLAGIAARLEEDKIKLLQ